MISAAPGNSLFGSGIPCSAQKIRCSNGEQGIFSNALVSHRERSASPSKRPPNLKKFQKFAVIFPALRENDGVADCLDTFDFEREVSGKDLPHSGGCNQMPA
jgi:hypothetical protein